MKKITTICLVVGLMISCTDNNSVDKKSNVPAQQETPQVLYKGSLYRTDDGDLVSLVTSSSMWVRFDFETYDRLFDDESQLLEFLKSSYSGKYASAAEKLLRPENVQIGNTELGSARKSLDKDGASRIENTIYDFELALLDGPCAAYPVQAWYVNLPSYPSGVISNALTTIGYDIRGFTFIVPTDGAISVVYKNQSVSCATGMYFATSSGCWFPWYTTTGCFGTDPKATYFAWSVVLDN